MNDSCCPIHGPGKGPYPEIGDSCFRCALWTSKQQLTWKVRAYCGIPILHKRLCTVAFGIREKQEIYAAAFVDHLFMTYIYRGGGGGAWPHWHPPGSATEFHPSDWAQPPKNFKYSQRNQMSFKKSWHSHLDRDSTNWFVPHSVNQLDVWRK